MFMYLPCWSLPKAHRLLQAKGATVRMEVQRGLLDGAEGGVVEGGVAPPGGASFQPQIFPPVM